MASAATTGSTGIPEFLCTACSSPIPSNKRDCVVCGTDNGCPNVRQAEGSVEKTALAERLADAEVSANARGCLDILKKFGVAVLSSSAVMARSLAVLDSLVKSDKSLYIPFYKQVSSGARIPEDNDWDLGRTAADSTVMPHYFEEISFAALSLDLVGLTAYGAYSIILKEQAIALRASVFEENPFIFNRRHRIIAGEACTPGYRATWRQRHVLAKAKLQSLLNSGTTPDQFAGILLSPKGAGTGDPDYIEVHIFGDIHRRAIERVIGPKPKHRVDRAILKSIEKALVEVGASLEVR